MSFTKKISFDICFALTVLTTHLNNLWKVDVLRQRSVGLEQPFYISRKICTVYF